MLLLFLGDLFIKTKIPREIKIVLTGILSIIIANLLGFSVAIYANTIQNWMLIFGGNDLSLWGIIWNGIAKLIGGA